MLPLMQYGLPIAVFPPKKYSTYTSVAGGHLTGPIRFGEHRGKIYAVVESIVQEGITVVQGSHMLNEYLGQEYPEGRALSMCRTTSTPIQQLEKGGSLGLPKPIDQEPPLQCVGTKRRWGELKPCHDYTGKGGRRMTPCNTEVSSSTLRIGHDILQPNDGGESIAETCAPAIQTTPINVHASKQRAINMDLGSVVNHDTWSSIPQHKLTGTCEEPVNEVVALDVGSTANAPILSDRYTSAVPHTGTQMLLRSFDLNSATCNLIKSPYYQGSSPEWHYKDLREQEGRTSKNGALFYNGTLNSIHEMDPTLVSPQYSTMANKEDIKTSDLSIRDKWAFFLRYLSYFDLISKQQPTSYKVNEGGKAFPVIDGGCKTLAHDLTTEPHQKVRVPPEYYKARLNSLMPADPHGHEGLQAANPTTRTDQTDRVSLAIGGTEYPAANGRREASAEIVAKGSHWSDDGAININKIGPEHGHAAESYDCKNGELSQNSLLNVMGAIPEHPSPGQYRRRYTGVEKQSAVDISNEKIYQGKGPNGTRGKKVTSKLLGIPISTLYKWESDGIKTAPNNTTEFVVDQPSNAGVQDSPTPSNAGVQHDSPKPSKARILQGSPKQSNAGVQHDSPKPSKARILQGSPKQSNAGVQHDSPKPSNARILQGSPKQSNAGVQHDLPKPSNAGVQDLPKFVGGIKKMHQVMRYTDEDKLAAIEMSREVTEHGTGRNGTRGKAAIARQIGVSVKTMWRWERNEHFYRTRLKQQQHDHDISGRKLLILQKACEMVRSNLNE
eukprot:343206_1